MDDARPYGRRAFLGVLVAGFAALAIALREAVEHVVVGVAQRDLGPTVSELTTFGEDPNGELYAVSRAGTVFRLAAG